jgi:hypothetical protein
MWIAAALLPVTEPPTARSTFKEADLGQGLPVVVDGLAFAGCFQRVQLGGRYTGCAVVEPKFEFDGVSKVVFPASARSVKARSEHRRELKMRLHPGHCVQTPVTVHRCWRIYDIGIVVEFWTIEFGGASQYQT